MGSVNQTRKPRVLVVDEEPTLLATWPVILEQHGYEATSAAGPKQAILTARILRPELLVTDVVMTAMNGIELALRVRTFIPRCQVLLMSGDPAAGELLEQSRSRGIHFDFLPKPIHPIALCEVVARLLRGRDASTFQSVA